MKDIEIKNYKCFDHLKINDLKRVNLFTGKNNTGKSTILEAIALYKSNFSNDFLSFLLQSRGEFNIEDIKGLNNEDKVNIICSLFPNRLNILEKKINIKLLDLNNYSEFYLYKLETDIDKSQSNIRSTDFDSFRIEHNDRTTTYTFDNIFSDSGHYSMGKHGFHSISNNISDSYQTAKLWDEIILSDKEDLVVNTLKLLEPDIEKLNFIGRKVGKERFPIVKLKTTGRLSPLKAMGDGINRILNIILALVNVDNGILLIDEFENGLHYSVQEKLWKLIFEVAEKLNVQVFATTHSNDAITSLANVLETNKKYEAGLYRMDRKNDDIRIFPFSKEEITTAAKQKIELR